LFLLCIWGCKKKFLVSGKRNSFIKFMRMHEEVTNLLKTWILRMEKLHITSQWEMVQLWILKCCEKREIFLENEVFGNYWEESEKISHRHGFKVLKIFKKIIFLKIISSESDHLFQIFKFLSPKKLFLLIISWI